MCLIADGKCNSRRDGRIHSISYRFDSFRANGGDSRTYSNRTNRRYEGELVRLRVVYPDGTKLQRNFLLSDDVGFLLDLVELDMYDNHMENELSELYMTMPRITVNEVDCL